MKRLVSYLLCASLLIPLINIFAAPSSSAKAQAGESARKADIQSGIQRLKSNTGGAALVSTSTATGAARFVRMPSGGQAGLSRGTGSAQDKSAAFFRDYGSAFGVASAANELKFDSDVADKIGGRHLTYRQVYMNVPVFAGVLKTHFDTAGVLRAVNGNFIPDINLNPAPSRKAGEAAAVAVEHVKANPGDGESGAKSNAPLAAVNSALYVFRANLARGIPGQNHLVWEVEVTNGADVRDRVYVDAHTLKVVDMISGNHEAMSRRAYDGMSLPNVPPGYPATPYWVEGNPFPTASAEANNMIISSKETYDFFQNAFGRDSYDGLGHVLDAIFDRGYGCPNASWNGTFISFCPGFTTDDVTTHEWGHAYTEYTHNLIYQWQPGALNEAYSDIWGETVDRINNRDEAGNGNSGTDPARTTGNCSSFSPPVAQFIINSPATIDGTFPAQAAQFGPALSGTGVTGNVVLAVDDNTDPIGGTDVNDGCGAITNGAALTGNIALIRRGTCNFSAKVFNAQQAGAVAVVIFNNVANGLPGMGAGVNAGLVTIPSVGVTLAEGDSMISEIATPPNVTMKSSVGTVDTSTKWLMGEDVDGFGALRDMWNPVCYSNPGKVTDTAYYVCSTADQGGVHTNSGVPNHEYALLVDGGTYNGQTISAIGLTKAAHIFFRAQTVYQHSASDFPDHADAIEQSATDLIGQNLASLTNGTPSGEIITAADVTEVQQAALAVELRTPPTFCGFQPLLAQSPPAVTCGAGTSYFFIFADDFEGDNSDWTVSNTPVNPATHDIPDWVATSALPDNRIGTAFYAANPPLGDCAADDESGVQHLESPTISIPGTIATPSLRFDHWVATELSFDGGQLSVSVDGGAYTLVPQAAYIYNAPNLVLATAGAGNTNPRQGQRAWSGTDGGSVDGSWGTTVVDLSQVGVTGGHTVRLRYDLGQDGCGGNFGWYIDNLQIVTCLTPTAAPAQISGRITTPDGAPLGGVSMRLSGARTARVITDAGGNYRFENVDGDNFYTVTPTLVNYHFSPESQSFVLAANNVDAVFTATRDAVSSGNAIDTADFFVRQHYLDFLGREPDANGFNFWSDQILSCGGDSGCRERRTINVSAAYFLAIEFQQTGGLVDGLYRASYGRRPFYNEFMPDTAVVARDVVVGRTNWAQQLEANKQAFVAAWLNRADFRAAYDGLGNDAYVDALISHAGAGFNGDRSALVSGLNGGSLSRAAVLRQVVENEGFVSTKHNEMFVMMEYFGYLRRDPDASGYQFWLNKLNQFGGNFEQAEMVKAFLISSEYRSRFGQP